MDRDILTQCLRCNGDVHIIFETDDLTEYLCDCCSQVYTLTHYDGDIIHWPI